MFEAAIVPAKSATSAPLICFSGRRWQFAFDRPEQLMSRLARARPVVFWEQPEGAPADCAPELGIRICAETGVTIVTPSLPDTLDEPARAAVLHRLLNDFLEARPGPYVRWYDAPEMFAFSRQIDTVAIVYDRAGAGEAEADLLDAADLILPPDNADGRRDWDRIAARIARRIDAIVRPSALPDTIPEATGRRLLIRA